MQELTLPPGVVHNLGYAECRSVRGSKDKISSHVDRIGDHDRPSDDDLFLLQESFLAKKLESMNRGRRNQPAVYGRQRGPVEKTHVVH